MDFIEVMGMTILLFLIGATPIIIGGILVRRSRPSLRVPFPWLLVIIHTVILGVCIALYPTGAFFADIPYDDGYIAYLFVPGPYVYWLGVQAAHLLWPWLQTEMSFHAASIVCIVYIPGLVGLLVGTVQWYVIGYLMQKLGLTMRLSELATRAFARLSSRSP